MSLGTDIEAEVAAAIAEAGAATGDGPLTGTILRQGALNESTYPVTRGADTEHACTLILSAYSALDRAGSLIQVNDLKAMIAVTGLDIVPGSGDRLRVAGTTYSIISVMTVQPGGVALYYEAQCRG